MPAFVAGLALFSWPLAFALAFRAGDTPSWQAGVLGLLVLASVWVPLRFQRGGYLYGATLEEAVLVAILALGAAPWAGVLLGGAVTLGHVGLGSRPTKVLFNGAQVAVSSSLAALAFVSVADGASLLSLSWFVGVLAAVVVYALVGLFAVTELFRLLDGRRRRELALESAPMVITTTAGNTVFGILLGFLAVTDERMLIIGLALTVAVQVGYRGYVRVAQDRRRTELLQETTSVLVEVAGDPGRLGDFLVRLTALLGARRAELVLLSDGAPRRLRATADGATEPGVDDGPDDGAILQALEGRPVLRPGSDDGEVSALAVPIIHGGQVLGAVGVLERHGLEPWSDIDLGLLSSLAHEMAVALRTVELFDEVLRERGRYFDESRKLTDVVNATSDGIVTLGTHGRVTVWNDAVVAITGTPANEAIGQPWFTVLRLRDAEGRDLADQQRNPITSALREGAAVSELDLQVLRRDGQWRWLRCTLNPVLSADDGTTGAVLVARDVTTQHELEGLKADFLATVSHELRTPLTPLMGFVEIMDRQGASMTDEHRTKALDSMRTQLQRLGKLVEDLLLTAESDLGSHRFELVPLELRAVVEQVVEQLDGSDRGRVSLEDGTPLHVVGDPRSVDRIARELVSNALKHTGGAVRVSLRDEASSVVVAVEDDGPGIAPQDHARVFERFGRLGDHLHRTQGPGLGLPIARALAEQLGGHLELDSDVTRGSVFSLHLPRADRAEHPGRGRLRAVS